MKIISYNVNGIRAAETKGLSAWVASENPDIICFQELKALQTDLPETLLNPKGYHPYYYSAEKKGYSGVGIWSKEEPKQVVYGCGNPLFDAEGRVIRADFENFSVISAYFPSGTSGEERQSIKEDFLAFFFTYLAELKTQIPNLIVAGDYNIAHQEIDIHDPKGNKNSTGFLPHEREWMSKFFADGWIDSFRNLQPNEQKYSWWSYRSGARAKNKGWRIDYISVSDSLSESLQEAYIYNDAVHSDHCPIGVLLGG